MEVQQTSFMSAEINEISAALSAFQGGLKQPELSKEVKVQTRSGSNYKFKYADLSTCVKAAAPSLKEHGLAVTQIITNGLLVTLLTHKSGQWFRSEVAIGNAADYQALGSAITYLKRYSYCAILGIVADSDDDANAACGNTAEVTDRKRGTAKSQAVAQVAFTGEQLKQAIAELDAASTEAEYQAVWQKYSSTIPSLCAKGTEFYNACIKKANELKA